MCLHILLLLLFVLGMLDSAIATCMCTSIIKGGGGGGGAKKKIGPTVGQGKPVKKKDAKQPKNFEFG